MYGGNDPIVGVPTHKLEAELAELEGRADDMEEYVRSADEEAGIAGYSHYDVARLRHGAHMMNDRLADLYGRIDLIRSELSRRGGSMRECGVRLNAGQLRSLVEHVLGEGVRLTQFPEYGKIRDLAADLARRLEMQGFEFGYDEPVEAQVLRMILDNAIGDARHAEAEGERREREENPRRR